ncbi:PREDICTED: protein ANTI-SILENCING 1-like isoform X2 [Nelumbo nucifera]|uniref:Protein ANTI-SILENCING 1-like n=2 Tax=Nelumbo nucifera TaxID=4432 RepID=A0A822Y798_NELNU|nr:PREDICTED: protein ANTI-SILENCING 1-like isoform X2 [Nelumbo nucifera]DAD27056.1 TPA_asm: hypothetical protein HUJ06_028524 [Nelumbo nucifera]
MQAMSHFEGVNKDCKLEWGKKKGVGGTNNDVQFYESFTYGNVEYILYDCVYLYTKGEPEPYIGKLVKIWEKADGKKKIKVVWFFRPIEIRNWLGDTVPCWNELFLASGQGVGLSNVNPLEVLVGKCNVICTSKDRRNPQPLSRDVKMADYIFYRTFDVGSCMISDNFEDAIDGIDVRYFFNKKKIQKFIPAPKVDKCCKYKTQEKSSPSRLDSSKAVDGAAKDGKDDHQTNAIMKGEELKETTRGKRQVLFLEENLPMLTTSFDKDQAKVGNISFRQDGADKGKSVKVLVHSDAPESRLSKKQRFLNQFTKPGDVEHNASFPSELGKESRTSVSQKLKVANMENAERSSEPFRKPLYKAKGEKVIVDDRATKLSGKSAPRLEGKARNTDNQVVGASKKPDRSKWFKQLSWEEATVRAHNQGTLILLENLDPSYTSKEVEDIIQQAFGESCTAKVIQRGTFSSPHNGQALAIFKKRDMADMVVAKLNRGCFMLPNGRPLIGSKGTLRKPSKTAKFVGHLVIEKLKYQKQPEERNAVSTSHFSQPNTIEYDMAVEWCLLMGQADLWWKALYQKHEEELESIKSQLKTR